MVITPSEAMLLGSPPALRFGWTPGWDDVAINQALCVCQA